MTIGNNNVFFDKWFLSNLFKCHSNTNPAKLKYCVFSSTWSESKQIINSNKKQPSRDVLKKKCSEDMQQTYRRKRSQKKPCYQVRRLHVYLSVNRDIYKWMVLIVNAKIFHMPTCIIKISLMSTFIKQHQGTFTIFAISLLRKFACHIVHWSSSESLKTIFTLVYKAKHLRIASFFSDAKLSQNIREFVAKK